jgi:hypothetical protein
VGDSGAEPDILVCRGLAARYFADEAIERVVGTAGEDRRVAGAVAMDRVVDLGQATRRPLSPLRLKQAGNQFPDSPEVLKGCLRLVGCFLCGCHRIAI